NPIFHGRRHLKVVKHVEVSNPFFTHRRCHFPIALGGGSVRDEGAPSPWEWTHPGWRQPHERVDQLGNEGRWPHVASPGDRSGHSGRDGRPPCLRLHVRVP